MGYRHPGDAKKSVLLNFKCDPEEADRIRGLASYLRVPVGEMLRALAEEKRRQLYDAGKRPPLRPPEE
jgi:hypothetical protein